MKERSHDSKLFIQLSSKQVKMNRNQISPEQILKEEKNSVMLLNYYHLTTLM